MRIETLDDLIAVLQEVAETGGGDMPVRIAYQPNYPLAASVAAVSLVSDDEDNRGGDYGSPVLWIAASSCVPYSENPYAPSAAWEE